MTSICSRLTFPAIHSLWPAIPLLMAMAHAPASAQTRPQALHALEARGLTIAGTFPSAGGLTAWAAHAGQQPVALYATPDGNHVIAGILLDAKGNEIDQAALEKTVTQPMSDSTWSQLDKSNWIADGSDRASRVVYVFTDPNCSYCNKLWADARPWVEAGKVQLRHVPVAVLGRSSAEKAAKLLSDKNPAAALAAHERAKLEAPAGQDRGGKDKPKPNAPMSTEARAKLEHNEKLMTALHLRATPGIVWRDANGVVHMRTGAPDSALPSIFGAR